jgi:hypothetical protein
VFLTQIADVKIGRLVRPQPEQAEQADQREVVRLAESGAVASMASNCRCDSPSVGDCTGTEGRRTYSAGECSSSPSMTQVR